MTRGLLAITILAGCGEGAQPAGPAYEGVETALMAPDLVSVQVAMRGAREGDVERYALCAAAGDALARGFAFARRVRTITEVSAGVYRADAVYTVSQALPRGTATIDAEVAAAECALDGIPTE